MKSDIEFWQNVFYDSSKKQVLQGISICEQEPELFNSLFELAMLQKGVYSQRSSRVICQAMEKREDLFGKFIPKILESLNILTDETIKFNFLKIFTFCNLAKDDESFGFLVNFCFKTIEGKHKFISSQVYPIQILYRISEIYPELRKELLAIILKYQYGASAAFINCSSKILSKLRNEVIG